MDTLESSWLWSHKDLILHRSHSDKIAACSIWRRALNQISPRVDYCFVVLHSFVVVEIYAFYGIVAESAIDFGLYHFDTLYVCANSRQEISTILSKMPQNDDSLFTTWIEIALLDSQCTHRMDMPLQPLLEMHLTCLQERTQKSYFASVIAYNQAEVVYLDCGLLVRVRAICNFWLI